MENRTARDAFKSYFRFNNQRTLSTLLPSELDIIESDRFTAFIDKTRRYDNQVVMHAPCTREQLSDALSLYGPEYMPEISIESWAESDSINQYLASRGYRLAFYHQFLWMPVEQVNTVQDSLNSIQVEQWGADRADDFLALLESSGLKCSPQVWQIKRSYYCTDQFRCFVALINGKPAGWATMFIDGRIATLANAFTQPQYRGQGCQTALLNARIQEAKTFGIEMLLTDVIQDSVSSRNCISAGFNTHCIKKVWNPA
ncbi:GNAT family N-acetyltransferase [Vibrio sp.]|uniref:GNAT family N-acetyltransferase n=1 Tax=Vibrio sp. TaxID=678 RepID=UPI003D0D4D67